MEDSSPLKDVLTHARIWLSLKSTLLTERSQPQKRGSAESAHTGHLGLEVGLRGLTQGSQVLTARDPEAGLELFKGNRDLQDDVCECT